MKKIFLCTTIFSFTIGLFGCGNQVVNTSITRANQPNKLNNRLPQVVVTTSILCDLTKQISHDTINLICLIPPSKDPHTYQPKPEDRQAIKQAKLVLYHGYNFESSLIKIITTTKNSTPKIAVNQRALPKAKQSKGNKIVDPILV
jgi:manganese/iron transport system substrate-binding protein